MIGTSISRWTMTYFAMALAWLFVALALMAAGIGYPSAGIISPDTLVLVHVISIGWLSLAMCGALFQFVPVLVAKPLFSEKLALPALALLTAGLIVQHRRGCIGIVPLDRPTVFCHSYIQFLCDCRKSVIVRTWLIPMS